MERTQPHPGVGVSDTGSSEYRSRRRRRQRRSRVRSRSGRLRLVYFGLASLWGFVVGSASLIVGLAYLEVSLPATPQVVAVLAGASLLAAGGGLIASRAYDDARQGGGR